MTATGNAGHVEKGWKCFAVTHSQRPC